MDASKEHIISNADLLEVEDLYTQFRFDDGVVRAVDGVSFSVPAGKTVCVVGESGCGKSITARSILQLIDRPGRITGGKIWWRSAAAISAAEGSKPRPRRSRKSTEVEDQTEPVPGVDLVALDPAGDHLREIRGGEIAMIFQEPMASLSPMYTIGNQLIEVIRLHTPVSKADATERALDLLAQVGIPRPKHTMDAYSFQLSGGMCQRVMIAIALSCNPKLLIADEPTTALDVTTQARILDLLRELQQASDMAMMFITHDLGVVAEIADEVVVMYLGTVVEQGPVEEVFEHPQHPYTRALLASIPRMGAGARQRLSAIQGQVPHPFNYPQGCPFHPRCPEAVEGVCDRVEPPTVWLGERRRSRCVLNDPEFLAETVPASEVSR